MHYRAHCPYLTAFLPKRTQKLNLRSMPHNTWETAKKIRILGNVSCTKCNGLSRTRTPSTVTTFSSTVQDFHAFLIRLSEKKVCQFPGTDSRESIPRIAVLSDSRWEWFPCFWLCIKSNPSGEKNLRIHRTQI